ncbi:MAG: hypothetical protein EBR10_09975 [Planctomycetes bacterium]|nr:hypothetical protein [Planctomycetota bacterium]
MVSLLSTIAMWVAEQSFSRAADGDHGQLERRVGRRRRAFTGGAAPDRPATDTRDAGSGARRWDPVRGFLKAGVSLGRAKTPRAAPLLQEWAPTSSVTDGPSKRDAKSTE